jgi:IS5 family transposase
MHQTKKGNQWYFGMKAHFGVDSRTKLIHAVVATPANVADSTVLPADRRSGTCVNSERIPVDPPR